MKTRVILLAGLFLFGLIIFPSAVDAKTVTFKEAIQKTIKYPAQASEQGFEGTVWVHLNILEDGTIKVIETNHDCCKKLYQNVVAQLNGQKIKKFDSSMAGEHNLKLVFQIRSE